MKLVWIILSWCVLAGQLAVGASAAIAQETNDQELSISSLNEDLTIPSTQAKLVEVKVIDGFIPADLQLRLESSSVIAVENQLDNPYLIGYFQKLFPYHISARAP